MCAAPAGARGAPCPAIAVRHLPLHTCALDGAAFVLPAAGGAAAAACLDGGVAGYGREDAAAPGSGARARPPCAVPAQQHHVRSATVGHALGESTTGCNVSNLICAIALLVCASLSGSEAARRAPAALTPAPARARLHESLLAPRASGAARRRPGRAGQRRPEADRACAGGPGGPAGPALGHLLTGARLAAAGCAGAGQDRVRLTTPGVSRPSGSLNQSRARFCDRRDPSFPGGPAWAGLAAYVKSARGGRHSCAPARSMSAMWQRWSSGRASRRSVLQ